AVAIVSSWFFLRGLRRESQLEIAIALLLAGAAILIRQIGLALPFGFAAAYLVRYGLNVRSLLHAMLFVVTGFALQAFYEGWLSWSNHLPANFGSQIHTLEAQLRQPWRLILADATKIVFYALIYSGLFLLPFLIGRLGS